MYNIFVYGSLKPGYANFNTIQNLIDAEPIQARIENASLYNLGHFPTVRLHDDYGTVYGYLIQGDNRLLGVCDFIEGAPDLFERKEVTVYLKTGGQVKAYVYELTDMGRLSENKKIQDGMWRKTHEEK